MKDLLKKYGHENDGCMRAILEYFNVRKGEWVNKAPLSLMQFPYIEKGKRKCFSPETIGRKARLLAEVGLLDRKEEDGSAWYRWPYGGLFVKKYEYVPVVVDGVRMMREIVVTKAV